MPGRVESVPLNVLLTDDARIGATVVRAAAAADPGSGSGSGSRAPPYAVHLVGDVDADLERAPGRAGAPPSAMETDDPSSEEEDSGDDDASSSSPSSSSRSSASSESSATWGSGDDVDDATPAPVASRPATGPLAAILGDDPASVAARLDAARRGIATGAWLVPAAAYDDPLDDDEPSWAYHYQTSGSRTFSRSSTPPSFRWTGALRPGLVRATLPVPALGWLSPLPDYARTGWPSAEFESPLQRRREVKTPEQIRAMRAACALARHCIDCVARAVEVGRTTDFLDRVCHVVCVSNGAYPSPRLYAGFPKSLCASVNEVVCHGVPDDRPLEEGDVVNLDVTVCLNGYHGDVNETYYVGGSGGGSGGSGVDDARKRSTRLMRCALECLRDATRLCAPGTRFRDLGEVIQRRADREGFGVVKDFCGHGIGELFHCAPNVPHYARNKAAGAMRAGMTFTIEPMVNEGSRGVKTWPDGWTAVTADGRRSAQYEHTLLVTEGGVEVLTRRTANSAPLWPGFDDAAFEFAEAPRPDVVPRAANE